MKSPFRKLFSFSTKQTEAAHILSSEISRERLLRIFIASSVAVIVVTPSLAATGGLGETMDGTSRLIFDKLSPIVLGVGCVIGCAYSIIKGSILGVVGSLGTTAIAGYTLNSIQTRSFLTLLGGE